MYLGEEPISVHDVKDMAATSSAKGDQSSTPQDKTTNRDSTQESPPSTRPVLRKSYFRRMMLTAPKTNTSLAIYWDHMWEPFMLLFRIPAVAYVATTYGFLLCWVAIMATTQATLFA